MTHRPCTGNGSSRLDLAESFLVYIASLLAAQYCQQGARPILSVAKHDFFSRTDCSGRRCFLCESSDGLLLLRSTNIFRHSKEGSTIASTATLSPVEQQRGFGQLSTINEKEPRAGGALSASTASMHEKDSPTGTQHSWLTSFIVDAHLSAPNRCQEVSSNGAMNTHAGSNSHHHSDSIPSMDRV